MPADSAALVALPSKHPGRLAQWVERQSDKSLSWARQEFATSTGRRQKLAGALVETAETLNEGRSFSQVYAIKRVVVVHDDGHHELRELEVFKPRSSRALALLGCGVALGSFASIAGYAVAAAGSGVFACIYLAARVTGQKDVAKAAGRMTAMTALMAIPVIGSAFAAVSLASELTAMRRLREGAMLALPAPAAATP